MSVDIRAEAEYDREWLWGVFSGDFDLGRDGIFFGLTVGEIVTAVVEGIFSKEFERVGLFFGEGVRELTNVGETML